MPFLKTTSWQLCMMPIPSDIHMQCMNAQCNMNQKQPTARAGTSQAKKYANNEHAPLLQTSHICQLCLRPCSTNSVPATPSQWFAPRRCAKTSGASGKFSKIPSVLRHATVSALRQVRRKVSNACDRTLQSSLAKCLHPSSSSQGKHCWEPNPHRLRSPWMLFHLLRMRISEPMKTWKLESLKARQLKSRK